MLFGEFLLEQVVAKIGKSVMVSQNPKADLLADRWSVLCEFQRVTKGYPLEIFDRIPIFLHFSHKVQALLLNFRLGEKISWRELRTSLAVRIAPLPSGNWVWVRITHPFFAATCIPLTSTLVIVPGDSVWSVSDVSAFQILTLRSPRKLYAIGSGLNALICR